MAGGGQVGRRLSIGGLAGLLSRCALVVSNDSGPLHVAAAVGAPTVGIYWCGNAINAAPPTRSRHRPLLSWTVHCPECGTDCSTAGHPLRPGDGCTHRPSFLAQIPVREVAEEVVDLLAAAGTEVHTACDRPRDAWPRPVLGSTSG